MGDHMSTLRLVEDAWILPAAGGVLVGKGTELGYRLRGGASLFDLWKQVQRLLDERPRERDELVTALDGIVPPGLVREALAQFMRLGLVVEATDARTRTPEEWTALRQHGAWPLFAGRAGDPGAYLDRLTAARVTLVGSAEVVPALRASLAAHGLAPRHVVALERGVALDDRELAGLVGEASFVVAAASDAIARLAWFARVGEAAHAARKPWLCGHLDGERAVVGPLIVPRETGCFRCLELREENHLPNLAEHRELRARVREVRLSADRHPAPFATSLLAQLLTAEAVRWLSRVSLPRSYGALVELDLVTLETTPHALLRVPLCDLCGPTVERPFRLSWNV